MTLKNIQLFGPDEPVMLCRRASIEQPVSGNGMLYLTERRLILIHKSGFLRKTETPLLDLALDEISYVRVEGTIWKVLVIGARTDGGRVVAYKVHTQNPGIWKTQIYTLKGSMGGIRYIPPRTTPQSSALITHAPSPPPSIAKPLQAAPKFCVDCGHGLPSAAAFCSACGSPQ